MNSISNIIRRRNNVCDNISKRYITLNNYYLSNNLLVNKLNKKIESLKGYPKEYIDMVKTIIDDTIPIYKNKTMKKLEWEVSVGNFSIIKNKLNRLYVESVYKAIKNTPNGVKWIKSKNTIPSPIYNKIRYHPLLHNINEHNITWGIIQCEFLFKNGTKEWIKNMININSLDNSN